MLCRDSVFSIFGAVTCWHIHRNSIRSPGYRKSRTRPYSLHTGTLLHAGMQNRPKILFSIFGTDYITLGAYTCLASINEDAPVHLCVSCTGCQPLCNDDQTHEVRSVVKPDNGAFVRWPVRPRHLVSHNWRLYGYAAVRRLAGDEKFKSKCRHIPRWAKYSLIKPNPIVLLEIDDDRREDLAETQRSVC